MAEETESVFDRIRREAREKQEQDRKQGKFLDRMKNKTEPRSVRDVWATQPGGK